MIRHFYVRFEVRFACKTTDLYGPRYARYEPAALHAIMAEVAALGASIFEYVAAARYSADRKFLQSMPLASITFVSNMDTSH